MTNATDKLSMARTIEMLAAANLKLQFRHDRLSHEFATWRAHVRRGVTPDEPSAEALTSALPTVQMPAKPPAATNVIDDFELRGHGLSDGFVGCRFCGVTLGKFFNAGKPQCNTVPRIPAPAPKPVGRPRKSVQAEGVQEWISPAEYLRVCEVCKRQVDIKISPYHAGKCHGCWPEESKREYLKSWRQWEKIPCSKTGEVLQK